MPAPEGGPDAPTATEVGQLIRLRAMLERAVAAARLNYTLDTGATTVLLDAVNERATHLVAVTRGLAIKRNDGLQDLFSQLKEQMPHWHVRVFPDIRALHLARNQAQHEGLDPAREHIPGWATATGAYVRSLIHAQFGLELDALHLSDALTPDDAAAALRQAEDALGDRRFADAVTLAGQAFDQAAAQWRADTVRPAAVSGIGFGIDDIIMGIDRSAQQDAADRAFATDPAELSWWRKARSEAQLCDRDDARRAVTFVFWWLVGWQRFTDSVVDRHERAMLRRRRTRRSPDDSPIISEITEFAQRHDGWKVTLLISDVPEPADYALWAGQVRAALAGWSSARVGPDGEIHVQTTEDELEPFVDAVVNAIGIADARADQLRIDRAQTESRIAADHAAFVTACESRRAELPAWVGRLVVSKLPGGTSAPAFIPALAAASVPRMELRDLLGTSAGMWVSAGALSLEVPLDPDAVIDALRAADGAVDTRISELRAGREQTEEHRRAAYTRITEALARHGISTPTLPPE